ncbi:hypothetical protein C7W88_06800 [Novosphingobium sp. THN1]|nr:hypothetical protein C7W88_06800 [Novosphingobium sp. THN1]
MRGARPLALLGVQLMDDKPNLVIGLICPAGTDLSEIKQQLTAQLSIVHYRCKEIKVSKAIAEALNVETISDEFERMRTFMDAGDKIRKFSSEGSGVASLIVSALRAERENEYANSTAFIIDSLKNPKEIDILDQIYGRNFYTISINSPKENRLQFLANKIARSRKEAVANKHFDQAGHLIEFDQAGEDQTGQSVRDTFPKGDFFVESGSCVEDIKRFIRLIFQDPFITPTLDEYMMFVAKATALRSCDLSRQVGAVISDKVGNIISTGCNEVPYPGGGFYFEGREGNIGDNRDKEEKHDPNFNEVKRSISEFLEILKSTGYIGEEVDLGRVADNLLHGDHKKDMENARFRNLIEFSRVVHAEMQAITQAAQIGRPLIDSKLYCTTFPCHLCARHIISSGIREVIYIEPYPKSLTTSLYHREIESEPDGGEVAGKITFRSFRGISPTLYQRVFAYRKRKDAYGAIAAWLPEQAMPIGAVTEIVRPQFETFVASQIATIVEMIHCSATGESTGTPVVAEAENHAGIAPVEPNS